MLAAASSEATAWAISAWIPRRCIMWCQWTAQLCLPPWSVCDYFERDRRDLTLVNLLFLQRESQRKSLKCYYIIYYNFVFFSCPPDRTDASIATRAAVYTGHIMVPAFCVQNWDTKCLFYNSSNYFSSVSHDCLLRCELSKRLLRTRSSTVAERDSV